MTIVQGLDYAFQPHPSITAIKKAGAKFVCRYLAGGTGGSKELTSPEAKALTAAGINIVVVWETTAGRAGEGHAAGKHDVHAAMTQAGKCGMPADRPIFFAVDFDAAGSEVAEYFKAVHETLGWRAGVYGSYRVCRYLHEHGLVGWSWQTYAWSGGLWYEKAHLQQYSNGHDVGGADCDYDRGVFADYGQWRVGWTPNQPKPKPDPVPTRVTDLRAAVNAWTGHHCKDLLGPLKTDGTWGRLDHKVTLRALYYFGFGLPSIRKWDPHITDQNMLDATDWFRHPSHFYKTHAKAQSIGKNRVAAERKKRKPFDGLAEFDGVRIAPWIQPILVDARKRGWQGTIPDKVYGGFRSYAQQKWLFTHDPPPVASPDLPSNHQLKDFDGGAVDCSYNDQLDSILQKVGSELGRQGSASSSDPVHFSSRTRFNRTGHY